ncbi:SH3 domain-containing protein [Thiothrix subterranea]|uniref:SH3 domain-containing protein n=1 Tax=Thiothrix subterranea TaxID=2735563 RepID=A0AA51MNM4_9GAMM|nr:SH3 domain-containing protein [Thiothrix subterranea]MDQ5767619.1 SH3 domain-containing protein [Thiothrix subterranea]WML85426.1 SH3 domain-containing protein [Thiothrix subterranea]
MKTASFFSALALALALSVSSVQAASDVYVITGVTTGEFLNMRANAGTGSSVVGRIPHNGQGIVTTGEEKKVGSTVWAKIYWNGVGGWVSKRYLLPEDQAANAPPAPTPAPAAPPAVVVPPIKVPSNVTPPPAKAASNSLVCSGTEPFWSIEITDANLNVNMMDGPRYSVPVTFRQTSANNATIAVIAGVAGANNTQAFMQKVSSCSDGMSDTNYPYSVTAVLNNQRVVSGCCQVR